MSIYAADAADALAEIAEAGGTVQFQSTDATYDDAADTWTHGTLGGPAEGAALELPSDPARMAALSLVAENPVTLLVAAQGLAVTPVPGMPMEWAGRSYSVKHVAGLAPDGVPILWTVVGAS